MNGAIWTFRGPRISDPCLMSGRREEAVVPKLFDTTQSLELWQARAACAPAREHETTV